MNKKIIILSIFTLINTFFCHSSDDKTKDNVISFCSSNLNQKLLEVASTSIAPYGNDGIAFLIGMKAYVNYSDQNGITPLMNAAKAFKNSNIDFLLKNNANINAKDRHGNTAIMLLSDSQEKDAFFRITDAIFSLKNADFDAQNNKGETALIIAIKNGLSDPAIEVISFYSKINLCDNTGSTALMWAAWKYNVTAVNLLLAKFADVNIKNIHGESFLDFLSVRPLSNNLWQNGYSKIYEHLKQYKQRTYNIIDALEIFPNEITKIIIEYHLPTETFDKANFQKLINRPLDYDQTLDVSEIKDINVTDYEGITPLIWSILKKKNNILKYILNDRNPDVTLCDKNGTTPLMHAAKGINNEFIDLLLKNGASINAKDTSGNTAVIWLIDSLSISDDTAIQIDSINFFQNADFDIQNNQGETALIKAIKRKLDFNIIKVVLNYSHKLNIQDNTGSTALLWTRLHGLRQTSIVELLLDLFVDVNIRNKNGESFFDFLKARQSIKELWGNKYSKKYADAENNQK